MRAVTCSKRQWPRALLYLYKQPKPKNESGPLHDQINLLLLIRKHRKYEVFRHELAFKFKKRLTYRTVGI
jgi:hypothetical protein